MTDLDSASLPHNDTSNASTSASNVIHFYPPVQDDNVTAWIIVGVVVGVIIIVFVLILVVRQLLYMFRHRDYESIINSPSNESLFENYNTGRLHIDFSALETPRTNTVDTKRPSGSRQHLAIESAIKYSKHKPSKKRKPKKKKKASKDEIRKPSASKSKSTVNFVSSESDDEVIAKQTKQTKKTKKTKKQLVTIITYQSDTNEDNESEHGDNAGSVTNDDPHRYRSRGASAGSNQSYYASTSVGFSATGTYRQSSSDNNV